MTHKSYCQNLNNLSALPTAVGFGYEKRLQLIREKLVSKMLHDVKTTLKITSRAFFVRQLAVFEEKEV